MASERRGMSPLALQFMKGAGMTVGLSLAGLFIGLGVGLCAGVLSARRIELPLLAFFINCYVFLVQGTPLYVQLLLMCYAVPSALGIVVNPLIAGVVTLGFNSVAYVAQIVRGGVNSIDRGQWEAAYVLGYSKWAALWHIILPQVIRSVLPGIVNEIIALIKETSILGVVGIVELTKVARDTVSRTMEPLLWYGCAALIYLCITTLLGLCARSLERTLEYDNGH
jgi:His/Glu/Gln/Arg/opine family amino acid ABC transporter permease subunit